MNLDLEAPCPTCLQPIGAECRDDQATMRGVHSDRAKLAKVMHLLPRVMHLLDPRPTWSKAAAPDDESYDES